MSRRGKVARREIPPDAKYHSPLLAKLINKTMICGKKSVAEGILYSALGAMEQETKRPPLDTLEQAVKNVTPVLEVKPRRVGGATYQVPIEIRGERRQALAIRWLLAAARARAGHSLAEKLAAEFLDAAKGAGAAIKKREDTHRMAEANRAFAHYRW